MAAQEVVTGTALEELNLPDELEAEGTEGDTLYAPVTWEAVPEFDGEQVGEYQFSPVLAEGYEVAEGVELPGIVVRVVKKPALKAAAVMRSGNPVMIGEDGYHSLTEAINAVPSGVETTITVVGDMVLSEGIVIENGKKIILQSADEYTITFNLNNQDVDCLKVNGTNSSLSLGGAGELTICLKGKGKSVLGCYSGAAAHLTSGATLKVADESSLREAVVYVCGSGSYDMDGGVVDGNESAQGVRVINSATFNMSGGTIQNGIKNDGGGVHVEADASFTMSGGTISGCSSSSNSLGGGGVFVSTSEDGVKACFIMSDGLIEKCEATTGDGGGVLLKGEAKFTMSGGTISDCLAGRNGGGVALTENSEVEFNLSGGTISGCLAGRNGGGVALIENSEAVFNLSGGTIENNKSQNGDGGGVHVAGGSFNFSGGTICRNDASLAGAGGFVGRGGGIAVRNGADFMMTGGTVSGNTARVQGGGIYLDKEITLQLYNTLVTQNTATVLGGGIWACRTGDIKIYLTDGGAVYDNSAEAQGAKTSGQAGDDIAHVVRSYEDYLPGTAASVSMILYPRMLGGGQNRYFIDGGVTWLTDDFGDSEEYGRGLGAPDKAVSRYSEENAVRYRETQVNEFVALKNVVSQSAKDGAQDAAKLVISGNTASRGAGIGTNGNLIIGTPDTLPKTGDLEVKKEVTGTGGNKNREFTFTIKLEPPAGEAAVNGEYGDMIFEDNEATVTLKHGESAVAEGLPIKTQYVVTETEANQDGYKTTVTNGEGVIADEKSCVSVTFVNHKDGPEEPEDPKNPEDPQNPDEPETPDEPESPGTPENPDQPLQPGEITVPITTTETVAAPATGDESQTALWLALLGGAGLILLLLPAISKKMKKTE